METLQEYPGEDHGTSAAGIIAASAMNRLGGRGAAFNARVTSFYNDTEDSLVLGTLLKMDHLNLVNASSGTQVYGQQPGALGSF